MQEQEREQTPTTDNPGETANTPESDSGNADANNGDEAKPNNGATTA